MKKGFTRCGKATMLALVFMVTCVGAVFAQESTIPQELVGKWKSKAIGSAVFVEFTEDGKMIVQGGFGGGSGPSDIVVVNDELKISNPNNGSSGSAKFKINGNTLKLNRLKGNTGLPIGSFSRQ